MHTGNGPSKAGISAFSRPPRFSSRNILPSGKHRTCQLQNMKRKANCMKRGVVSVERYLPNCDGPYDSEG